MYITAFFTDNGVPKTGLTPLIYIYKVSDDSLLIDGSAMSEIAGGWYKYSYGAYDATIEYVIYIDGTATLSGAERYKFCGNEDDLEISGKIPTNNFMGSSVKTDLDDEIDAIKAKTDNLPADTEAELIVIKGILGYNSVLEFTFDGNNDNTAGKLYLYNTKANAEAHVDGSGLQSGGLFEFTLTGVYTTHLPDIIKKVIEP